MDSELACYGHRPIARYQNGNTEFLHGDALGSSVYITEQPGWVSQKLLFYPWGQRWASWGVLDERFASLGERDAETGNDPTPFRMYQPRLYRWLSPDPVAGDISNPQSLNRYAYVMNNPANFTDPLGLGGCNIFNVTYEGSGNGFPCNDASTHTSQPAESPTSIAGPTGVATGSMIGYTSPDLAEGEKRYASNFGWLAQGSLYGKYYKPTFFSSLDAYFDWRTDIAALPESQVYSVFAAMCQNQGCDPDQAFRLRYVFSAMVYNLTWDSHSVERANLEGYWKDPATVFHDESWYSGFFFDTPHLIQNVGQPFEAHVDPFGPLNPLHYLIQIPSMLLPAGQSGTATCSLNAGCTLGH